MPFFVKTMDTVSDIAQREDSFSYDVVNKHFKNIFEKSDHINIENLKKEVIQKPIVVDKIEPVYYKTSQSIGEDYLRSNLPFLVFFNNRLIFDSETTLKNNLQFNHNNFTLYGRSFPYQGMMIRYK